MAAVAGWPDGEIKVPRVYSDEVADVAS